MHESLVHRFGDIREVALRSSGRVQIGGVSVQLWLVGAGGDVRSSTLDLNRCG